MQLKPDSTSSRGRAAPTSTPQISETTIAAFQRGDHDAFAAISRHHQGELRIHCYRMVGSVDEAEDLVQETFLRAWRRRDTYERRATIRAWLYRIATNACIDAIRKRTTHGARIGSPDVTPDTHVPWMQPVPDAWLDTPASEEPPDAHLVTRESIELAFLLTLQLLPAKQRAVLLLRDVLDFSAAETARLLDDTAAAVNSALQRARATLRRRRPAPGESPRPVDVAFEEAVFLQAFMDAQQRGDVHAIVDMLRDDVRMTLFPDCVSWNGCTEVAAEFDKLRNTFGDARSVAVAANRQPAVAVYRRGAGEAEYRAWAIVLLGVAAGKLREIATFASPALFARFNLPATLPEGES